MNEKRKSYPSDVSDEEWPFCVNYLTLMTEKAPQRVYPLREIFNGLRWFVRAGCPWRLLPNDLPPWSVVFQQIQRRLKAGCFEDMGPDLRATLRLALERKADPSAVILDSRTLQSTPESGARAGFDGHKKRKSSKADGFKFVALTARLPRSAPKAAQTKLLKNVPIRNRTQRLSLSHAPLHAAPLLPWLRSVPLRLRARRSVHGKSHVKLMEPTK